MQIEEIFVELRQRGIIDHRIDDWIPLSGGTLSTVYALRENQQPKLIVKMNDPLTVRLESEYLKFYKSIPLFAQMIQVHENYEYFVYTYQTGEATYPRKHKKAMLHRLVTQLINHTKEDPSAEGYGYQDKPSPTWQDFLLLRYGWAQETLERVLSAEDHKFVEQLIRNTPESGRKYLLHGDCGVHNFIFEQEQVTGVIDPIPTIGEPLYDLIYAFCSSPDSLEPETIEHAVKSMDGGLYHLSTLYADVLIGLYFRMATCIVHHPQDLEEYLQAWNIWKMKVEKE
ncbi:hypothetical protein BVG16_13350 [Paenibacillus selenitireducens]|uniref:Aminoglycoside phosphotransferase domain-containing protein n=1 Tax=Paenibacillus selenitireducens TaxID=1324314 RepID=A0A1T2XC18_9BACL|nr:phosphotransferase [Paenibacillus selenitireducens]OPA77439.1 hypothetical protein BVG16_13350 [Paenibacillus selenitireducens]